jgi:hypothetical protein
MMLSVVRLQLIPVAHGKIDFEQTAINLIFDGVTQEFFCLALWKIPVAIFYQTKLDDYHQMHFVTFILVAGQRLFHAFNVPRLLSLSLQLYEINDDPKRKLFLDDLFLFMQKRGKWSSEIACERTFFMS